jgi:5-methylcytosine-specific restriction endonuclease McrA
MTETTTTMPSQGLASADSGKPTGAQTPADALGESKRMSTNESEAQEFHECPECGEELSTESGLKTHYGHMHDGSLVEMESCEWCGEEFRTRPSRRGTFCSFECRGEYRAENGFDARSRRSTIECETCGDAFTVPQNDAESGRSYCSRRCYLKDSEREWRGCEWCGDEYRGYDDERFCSLSCYGQWYSENLSGEDHPNWKGGAERYYGPSWQSQRQKALDRDGGECQVCGSGDVHVHHIRPFRKFGVKNHAEANQLNNLICLCPRHHGQWEGIPLRPQTGGVTGD